MKKLKRSALVAFSAQKMFALVNDIEAYPQFMKGCKAATILTREQNQLTARLELEQLGLKQHFTTCNTLVPNQSMHMRLVDGPFKHFEGLWEFEALEADACKITFKLTFEFSNPIIGFAAGKIMNNLAGDQVDAICQRAKALYG